MFGKNKNKKVGLCVMVVTASLVLAVLWAVLATPETALAKKPSDPGGGGGGKGGAAPNCVIFDDDVGDSVRSDDGTPYCNNKKENITVKFVKFSHNSHLHLQTNSTDKAAAGRGLFIDFGTGVKLAPGTDNEMTINTTDDALAVEDKVLGVSADLRVGAHQEFDFYNMPPGVDDNVNLRIRVWFYFTDGSRDSLLIRLAPNGTGRYCSSSDSVTVTRFEDDPETGLRMWRVDTQELGQGACLSRSGECEEDDTDSDGNVCLLDVVTPGLIEPAGHIALSFGFTVTAAP